MKTTLSVRDFTIIARLLDKEMGKIRYEVERELHYDRETESYRDVLPDELDYQLLHHQGYQELNHLLVSLGNLQVEVHTPDVVVEDN